MIVGFFAAHVRRRARDRALVRLHDLAVLRLAVGQVRATARGGRFHLVVLVAIVRRGRSSALTAVDPIKVTEYSIVLSAAALPLTYFPILVVANDPDYMGDKVNGRVREHDRAASTSCLLTVVAVATIPLMIATKAGS